MVILIGALYVVIPALFLVMCWALGSLLSFCPVIEEDAMSQSEERTVIVARIMRDQAAKKAVQACYMYKATHHDVWKEEAFKYNAIACAWHEVLVGGCG